MIIDCYVLSCGQFFTYEQFAATNDTLVQLIGFAFLKHTSHRYSDITIKTLIDILTCINFDPDYSHYCKPPTYFIILFYEKT